MHVLRQTHKTLRPAGVLLDLHPQPKDPRIEIVTGDRSIPIGTVDGSEDSRSVQRARRRLAAVQREGLFRLEGRRRFDLRIHHESVEEWLEFRRDHDFTSVIPPDLLHRARQALRSEGAMLVFIEPVRASALRRAGKDFQLPSGSA